MSWTVLTADQLQKYYDSQRNQSPYSPIIYNYNNKANPWDTNPPLGTTPNLVWPQNQNPFQYQGGVAPWPHHNNESLVPEYMPSHGIPENHMTNQPRAGLVFQNNCNTNNSKKCSNQNNSNDSKPGNNMAVCPCCGNITIKQNIRTDYNRGYSDVSTDTGSTSSRSASSRSATSRSHSSESRQYQSYGAMNSGGQTNANYNAHCPAHGSISGTQSYMNNPYLAYYMEQVKAYQNALNPQLPECSPSTNTCRELSTKTNESDCTCRAHSRTTNNTYNTASTNSMQGNDGYQPQYYYPHTANQHYVHQNIKQAPAVPHDQLVNQAYQQSVDNMRRVQDRFQNMNINKPVQAETQKKRYETSHDSITAPTTSRQDTDVKSFTSC